MNAPTSKHEHVKVPNMLPLPRKMQLFFKSPTPANVFGKYLKKTRGFDTFCNVQNSLRLPRKMQF
jgi:hypothetical protein